MDDKLPDLVLEFLEAAIHETLFSWQVYPAEAFERAVLYDVPVHMSHHPLLSEYIHSALRGCRDWLANAELAKLSLVALSEAGRVVQTLVFEPRIVDPHAVELQSSTGEQEPSLPLRQLEEVLRTALVSLVAAPLTVGGAEKTADKPTSFRILAHTLEDPTRTLTTVNGADASAAWVLADQIWRGEMARQPSVFPLKTAQSVDCPVRINLFMQSTERS